jgi:hypothetical protein
MTRRRVVVLVVGGIETLQFLLRAGHNKDWSRQCEVEQDAMGGMELFQAQ